MSLTEGHQRYLYAAVCDSSLPIGFGKDSKRAKYCKLKIYENFKNYLLLKVVLTHLVHGASQGEVPVLAVHVVRAGAGVITEPDAVVLDDASVLLRQLLSQIQKHKRTAFVLSTPFLAWRLKCRVEQQAPVNSHRRRRAEIGCRKANFYS